MRGDRETRPGSFTGLQQYKGYAKLEKESRKPDPETHVDQTCTDLRTVAQ